MGFLQHRSKRRGYDGWALLVEGAPVPLLWTVSTTRDECRQLMRIRPDLFSDGARIVKVRIAVSPIEETKHE
jgi:hypothetical protein